MSLARYLSKLAALVGSDGKVPAAALADGAVGTSQLANSGVTAGTYGSASAIPAITVDAKGRVTSASESAFSSAYVGAKSQLFTSTGTFTVPAGVTAVKVTVLGGGGGGGGNTAVPCGSAFIGGGGAAGGVSIVFVTGLTPGGTVTVTVGAGGTAGASGGSGGTGGTSSFGAYASATGGAGGAVNGTGGAYLTAGTGSGGTLNFQSPMAMFGYALASGAGENSFFGTGGARRTTVGNGNSPTVGYGGGASGSYSTSIARAGAAGKEGMVLVEW